MRGESCSDFPMLALDNSNFNAVTFYGHKICTSSAGISRALSYVLNMYTSGRLVHVITDQTFYLFREEVELLWPRGKPETLNAKKMIII